MGARVLVSDRLIVVWSVSRFQFSLFDCWRGRRIELDGDVITEFFRLSSLSLIPGGTVSAHLSFFFSLTSTWLIIIVKPPAPSFASQKLHDPRQSRFQQCYPRYRPRPQRHLILPKTGDRAHNNEQDNQTRTQKLPNPLPQRASTTSFPRHRVRHPLHHRPPS